MQETDIKAVMAAATSKAQAQRAFERWVEALWDDGDRS